MREDNMKKNKGYSLVELLVAMVVLIIVLMEVYMVMNSGSKVYEHGSIDVALQTEAQQTILELEDLIIDVNSDIIYTPKSLSVSQNGTLKIVNHDDTYIIRYDDSDAKTGNS
jgi:prepilin-type N-terminal cleavage/methylation domain-containing protein